MRRICTERLVLRDPVLSDSEFLQNYQKDERYLEFYVSKPDAIGIIRQAINWSNERPRCNFQYIVVTRDQEVIGCAGLRTKDCTHGEAEIGIEIDPKHWKQGYAREVLNAIIRLARSLGITFLYASTDRRNFRAISLMKSESFTEQKVVGNDVILSRCL